MNQFIFYKSFYDGISCLPDDEQLKLYKMICEYCFNGKEPEEDGMAKGMFLIMKPNIDSNNKRYMANVENGKKGGRPKTQPKPNQNPSESELKPNQNLNIDKDIDKDIDIYIDNNRVLGEEEDIKQKHCYGEFKRIKLTDKEYNKLINDYGEEVIKEKIQQLDEYIQMNNNKNKYKDFNLVLRKAIRENWFKKKEEEKGYERKLIKDEDGAFHF